MPKTDGYSSIKLYSYITNYIISGEISGSPFLLTFKYTERQRINWFNLVELYIV